MINQTNEHDIIKFIEIIEKADGGCAFCVTDLLERFKEKFPEHKELIQNKILELKKDLEW